MKRNKGFTLIELLAVIVVLAVIALITTPLISNVIEKSKKGALQDSAYGLIESANIYYAQGILDESNTKTEFTFQNGEQTSESKLSYKGKIENGSLRLYSDGKSAVCITEGNYAAIKNVNEKTVTVVKGRCSYNSETEEYETVGVCQDLQDEIEALKKKHQEEIDDLIKKI